MGAWFDYCSEHGRILEFYPFNHCPLWTSCFSDVGVVDKALKYLEVRGTAGGLGPWGRTPLSP